MELIIVSVYQLRNRAIKTPYSTFTYGTIFTMVLWQYNTKWNILNIYLVRGGERAPVSALQLLMSHIPSKRTQSKTRPGTGSASDPRIPELVSAIFRTARRLARLGGGQRPEIMAPWHHGIMALTPPGTSGVAPPAAHLLLSMSRTRMTPAPRWYEQSDGTPDHALVLTAISYPRALQTFGRRRSASLTKTETTPAPCWPSPRSTGQPERSGEIARARTLPGDPSFWRTDGPTRLGSISACRRVC